MVKKYTEEEKREIDRKWHEWLRPAESKFRSGSSKPTESLFKSLAHGSTGKSYSGIMGPFKRELDLAEVLGESEDKIKEEWIRKLKNFGYKEPAAIEKVEEEYERWKTRRIREDMSSPFAKEEEEGEV